MMREEGRDEVAMWLTVISELLWSEIQFGLVNKLLTTKHICLADPFPLFPPLLVLLSLSLPPPLPSLFFLSSLFLFFQNWPLSSFLEQWKANIPDGITDEPTIEMLQVCTKQIIRQ